MSFFAGNPAHVIANTQLIAENEASIFPSAVVPLACGIFLLTRAYRELKDNQISPIGWAGGMFLVMLGVISGGFYSNSSFFLPTFITMMGLVIIGLFIAES